MALGQITIELLAATGSFVTDTERATKSLKKFKEEAVADSRAMAASFGLISSAGIAAAAGVFSLVKSGADAGDALQDAADITGSTVEKLSALEDVARRNGGTLEVATTAVSKFNQVLGNLDPKGSAAQVLEKLGLDAKKLKDEDPSEALRLTAVALAGYADDGNKARVVQELFGKSIKEVGPFLKDLAEQTKLVGSQTTETAQAGERFNKNLFELQTAAGDSARALANQLIPSINETIALFREGAKEGKGFFEILRGQQFKIASDAFGFGDSAANAAALRKQVAGLDNLLQAGAMDAQERLGIERERVRVAGELVEMEARLALKNPSFRPSANYGDTKLPSIGDVPKPMKTEKVVDEAAKYLESLKHQLQGVQDLTAYEKVLEETQTGRLKKATAAQLDQAKGLATQIDVQAMFKDSLDESAKATKQWLDEQIRGGDAARKFLDQVKEENDELRDQIEIITGGDDARRNVELRRLADAIATREQAKALAELHGASEQELADIDASIAKLQERRSLIRDRNAATDKFNEPADIRGRLGMAEARAGIGKATGRLTGLDELAAIGDARKKAASEIQAYIVSLEQMGAGTSKELEALRLELEQLQATADPLAKHFNEMFEDSFGDAFGDFITGTKSAKEAFRDFMGDIAHQVQRMAAKGIAEQIFGGSSPSSGGGWGSAIGSFISSYLGSGKAIGGPTSPNTMHPTGEVGPEVYRDSRGRNYLLEGNRGGWVDPSPKWGGGRSQVNNVTVTVPGNTDRRTGTQIGAEVARKVAMANIRNN